MYEKKKKCARTPEIYEILPNSAIPLSLCSNFLSEEIEKSLRVSALISMPVKDLLATKKGRERERRAKKGSAQIKHFIMSTNEAGNSKRHYPR